MGRIVRSRAGRRMFVGVLAIGGLALAACAPVKPPPELPPAEQPQICIPDRGADPRALAEAPPTEPGCTPICLPGQEPQPETSVAARSSAAHVTRLRDRLKPACVPPKSVLVTLKKPAPNDAARHSGRYRASFKTNPLHTRMSRLERFASRRNPKLASCPLFLRRFPGRVESRQGNSALRADRQQPTL